MHPAPTERDAPDDVQRAPDQHPPRFSEIWTGHLLRVDIASLTGLRRQAACGAQ